MNISSADSLVGAVALEHILLKLKPQIDQQADFRGAFHVLSGFSPEQLVGFIRAKEAAGQRSARLQIQFPEFELRGFDVAPHHTTLDSSVKVRNRERNGYIVLTAEVELDAEASLSESDRTDASDLKSSELAPVWIEFVSKAVACSLFPDDRKRTIAILKGLFETGRCPTSKVGEFITSVLEKVKAGEVLTRAAGKSLPVIGLPLHEDCFSSLNEVKMGQPSQWASKFKSHYALECYLCKRGPDQQLLDQDQLRSRLAVLKSEEHQPPIPEALQNAFSDYIESEGARNPATERLLYQFDWSLAAYCFERARKSSAKDFAERTRNALDAEGITPSPDDDIVLHALSKTARKQGGASEEFVEFFERRNEAIEKDPRLYLEWEDFVHGKKIECSDLFEGIFECIKRAARALSASSEGAYVVLEGKQQKKPNSFAETNQKACEFFERNYKDLTSKSNGRIRFTETKICEYSSAVLPKIKDKTRFKGSSKSNKANTLKFVASVFETHKGEDKKIVSLALEWKYPGNTVLGQEKTDFDSLCRYHVQRGTALVEAIGEYEVVGRKGMPLPLKLDDVEGFADVARGGGRGAFVPAQDRIKPLAANWKDTLKECQEMVLISAGEIDSLQKSFDVFHSAYNAVIIALRSSSFDTAGIPDLSEKFRILTGRIHEIQNQDVRRQLLRIILRIGVAQIPRSGGRPSAAVICPWNPIRMEAVAGRQHQILGLIEKLLCPNRAPFSDGSSGALFFREVEQLLNSPLYPEVTVVWDNSEAQPRVVTEALGGYTLHQSPDLISQATDGRGGPGSATSAIEAEMTEYFRLQPHERDNFSILLYDCSSTELPNAVVETVNKINAASEDRKITCQVLLMHREEEHLRQVYRDLVARGYSSESDIMEASGDFLAKVRVNITAPTRVKKDGRSQPVDIAFCQDLISKEAKPVWDWVQREVLPFDELQPHQWSRRHPVSPGDRKVKLQLTCPAQTESGWTHLYSVAALCAQGADDAWMVDKCPVLVRCLDFDDQRVERIFRETHELATWVVNQDELLDRTLLEAQDVKVIRYVQAATHGRNLIISSGARETLLVNTLKEKLKALLPSDTAEEVIDSLCKRCVQDANRISGGLVLKAARRANNTNELLGMVLSRYLVQSELGQERPIAWCFLDDYSQWLGKKEGNSIADLLVLAPRSVDGRPHLDVIVTEAKFVTHDALEASEGKSGKQLLDTLAQLTEALDGNTKAIDQDIWLARLSDLLVGQTVVPPGKPRIDSNDWRRAIRQRKCSVSIWGYSHIFVNESATASAQIGTVRGLYSPKGRTLDALQEVFGPAHVRELLMHFLNGNNQATADLRLANGHPAFGTAKLYHLSSASESNDRKAKKSDAIAVPPAATNPTQTGSNTAATTAAPAPTPAKPTPPSVSSFSVSDDPILRYLEAHISTSPKQDEAGDQWLEAVTTRLRQALVSRGLPAKLAGGCSKILTPNAGIVKIQGTKELTVDSVEQRSSEIFTSDGIKILNVTPESGRVAISVERPSRQVLRTEPVLLAFLRAYHQSTHGEKLCVGIGEEDGAPVLLDPLNQPHTLIAGITGSGKSVLMQNLILTIASTRSPQEAQIYIIDPKFGVDYRPLDELPHVQAGSGGIIDDPVAASALLAGLVGEMNERYELFKESKVPNIHAYRRKTGAPLPTLWVIHDEFADWMQTEEYRDSVTNIVGRLSVKARAAGIFLMFAAQRPDKDVMPMQLRSQLGNRLILKVDNSATAEIAMGEKNSGAERLLGRGHMLVKTGDTPAPVYAQVPFIDSERGIPELVRLIQLKYTPKSNS